MLSLLGNKLRLANEQFRGGRWALGDLLLWMSVRGARPSVITTVSPSHKVKVQTGLYEVWERLVWDGEYQHEMVGVETSHFGVLVCHIVTRVIENARSVHAHGPLNLFLYIVNILGRYGHSLGVWLLLNPSMIQHSFMLHLICATFTRLLYCTTSH